MSAEERSEVPETNAVASGTVDVPEIENRFTYHQPKDGQPEKYTALRDEAKDLAYSIQEFCPPSRESALALTRLEEAIFWANAAIARRS